MRCRQVVQTNPSRYSFKLVMILAKRTMLDGSPPSAVRLQTASSIAIDFEIPALFNQESIWLQEIENPQTIMCGSSCVSNHRNPSLRGEVLLMIPMECRRIVLFLNIQVNWHCSRIQLIPWQETPSNEGNTSMHYAKQDLLEQATEEQRFLNPQSLSVSSVEQGLQLRKT